LKTVAVLVRLRDELYLNFSSYWQLLWVQVQVRRTKQTDSVSLSKLLIYNCSLLFLIRSSTRYYWVVKISWSRTEVPESPKDSS